MAPSALWTALALISIHTVSVYSHPTRVDISADKEHHGSEVLALREEQSITVDATPIIGGTKWVTIYTIPVFVGPPLSGKKDSNLFPLLFDTGSPATWVFSKLPADAELEDGEVDEGELEEGEIEEDREGHKLYHLETTRDRLEAGNLFYAQGAVQVIGAKAADVVAVLGVKVEKLAFTAAAYACGLPSLMSTSKASGLFGADLSPNTWLPQSPLPSKSFLVNFNQGSKSTVTFGTVSANKLSNPVTRIEVLDPKTEWVLKSDDRGALKFDTGTSQLYLPRDAVEDYFERLRKVVNYDLPRSGDEWLVPCKLDFSKLKDPPILKITLRGRPFEIPGPNLIGMEYESQPDWCYNLLSVTTYPDYSLIGLPFFHTFNVLFDQDAKKIGFMAKH